MQGRRHDLEFEDGGVKSVNALEGGGVVKPLKH